MKGLLACELAALLLGILKKQLSWQPLCNKPSEATSPCRQLFNTDTLQKVPLLLRSQGLFYFHQPRLFSLGVSKVTTKNSILQLSTGSSGGHRNNESFQQQIGMLSSDKTDPIPLLPSPWFSSNSACGTLGLLNFF